MNENQAFEVLDTIAELYPKYGITKRKVNILLPQLKLMDYNNVLEKLSAYAADYPYPPTLAEIAAYPPATNIYLEQMRQWKREAAQVPEERRSGSSNSNSTHFSRR
ncbi:hypothetical protein [Aquibacillus rhizosphaerae]|uniref:Replicative helicase inhibitor G39P N-terminal domain-containing protein n=1 Tax=Aquibacillus rhizosphaerae TaxID=3051431 RepID=A0ABT7L0X4_9BACI|nr:hypothetical protein [Aquibacillus sp. LR5S19]MDL4839499.1 hypothetical protein [Aquibacillus sp. LR5S19]